MSLLTENNVSCLMYVSCKNALGPLVIRFSSYKKVTVPRFRDKTTTVNYDFN